MMDPLLTSARSTGAFRSGRASGWRSRAALLLLMVGLPAGWGGIGAGQAAEAVYLNPGDDFQGVIDRQGPGTRYVIRAGVHRGVGIVPQDGDVITGEPGAVLNGCLELADWRQEGGWWVHDAPVVVPDSSRNGVFCANPVCTQTQDLYVDGIRLVAVRRLDAVLEPTEWFFDKEAGRIFLRRDPAGQLVELGGPVATAINCAPPQSPARLGVVIEDLTIEKYPCPPQIGAIRLGGGSICRRCRVTGSHAYGIQLTGAATVQDCGLYDNGMCGIGGTGLGAIVEGCEISGNVWSYFAGPAWDNGGIKIAGSSDSIIRRNYIHHNNGPGLWTDIKTHHLRVEDNIVEFNHWEGILFEISDHLTATRNICRWNGVSHRGALWGAQICVQNSRDVDLSSNYLETGPDGHSPWGSGQAVMAINQVDRAYDQGVYSGDFSVRNVSVHHNLIVMASAGHSGIDYGTLGWATYADFLAAGMSWHDNRYLAGAPLDLRWSWRLPQGWDNTVAHWLRWEDWSALQDPGSSLATFGPDEYPATGERQHALIRETTGHDYPVLKAQLTRRPPDPDTDADGDGLSDFWERKYFGSTTEMTGADDGDRDGWSNLQEQAAQTNPRQRDTDGDGLPDAWEADHELNPLVFDSDADSDHDGRSAREEREDGTDLHAAEPPDLPIPESTVSLWLTAGAGLETGDGGVVRRWIERSVARQAVGWFGQPRQVGASPAGAPLVDPGEMLQLPGRPGFWGGTASGFTMVFAFQPTAIDFSGEWQAIATNETYRQDGFRLRLQDGIIVWSSGQSGGTLTLAGHTRLEAGRTYVITLASAATGGRNAMYLDGRVEAWTASGETRPSLSALVLGNTGGVRPQPGRFGDVVVFNRALTHRERRSVEGFLMEKFLTGLAANPDRDRDGLPDAYELAHQLDPTTPDALRDDDGDGESNLGEFQRGLEPQVPDSDGDGLPDGWEVAQHTNPLGPDADGDPDQDGLNNQEEFEDGSDPQQADGMPASLAFVRQRLWWRADHGLEMIASAVPRWRDSGVWTHDGVPAAAGASIPLAATPWQGRPVVACPSDPMIAAGELDLRTSVHTPGLTVIAALRPTDAPAVNPTAFQPLFEAAGVRMGVLGGRLAMRSTENTTVLAASPLLPTVPVIVSWTVVRPSGLARIFVNGVRVAEGSGIGAGATGQFTLGGAGAWSGDVGEVIVYAGVISHRDRTASEAVLAGKWLNTGSEAGDPDGDQLPSWWERQAVSDPTTADGDQDSDWDGIANRTAFQNGRAGFVWMDDDRDGMHDGWERLHRLDPSVNDADLDADSDGLANVMEQALQTDPQIGTNSATAWSIANAGAAGTPEIQVLYQNSHRSWAVSAGLEQPVADDEGQWAAVPHPGPRESGPGQVSLFRVALKLLPGSASSALYRLRLRTE